MALQGSLKIGGRTYGVVECEYSFVKTLDETGKPSSRASGGQIKLKIPATNDDDMLFYNWMFSRNEAKSGIIRLRIFTNDNKISYKTIAFANAYCVALSDKFCDNDEKLMYTTITLSAQIIRIGSANSSTFVNPWTPDIASIIGGNLGEYLRDALADVINPF